MKRKKAAIQQAVEGLQSLVASNPQMGVHIKNSLNGIQRQLMNSLKSKKELQREALWGMHGACRQWQAENAIECKKAKKARKK